MACRYKFSEAEIQEIEQVRAKNKDKRVEARLKALELRSKGASLQEVSNATSLKRVLSHYWCASIERTESQLFPVATTMGIVAT